MPVTVRIPEILQTATGGEAKVTVDAGTVGQMLDAIDAKYPGVKERLVNKNSGQVNPFVNIFVDEEDIRFQDGLDTKIDEKSDISILPAVAGGAAKASKKKKGKKAGKKGGDRTVMRVYLTFDETTTMRPMVYELIRKFDVIPNIRTASCQEGFAIMSVAIEGDHDALDQAFKWLRKEGVRVDPVELNVLES